MVRLGLKVEAVGLVLEPDDFVVIRAIVLEREPNFLAIVAEVEAWAFTLERRERLQTLLMDEFSRVGLNADDEPNEFGHRLDSIIGALMYYPEMQ